jgi:hypothetical protein
MMQTTFKELFGLTMIGSPINVKTVSFNGGMAEFTFLHGYVTCSVSIPEREFKRLFMQGSSSSPKSTGYTVDRGTKKQGIKEEIISDEEMNGPLKMGEKPTRKIKCPMTLEMITSEEYQVRKLKGEYKDLPKNSRGQYIPRTELKPE